MSFDPFERDASGEVGSSRGDQGRACLLKVVARGPPASDLLDCNEAIRVNSTAKS